MQDSLRDKMRRKGVMPTLEDIKIFGGAPLKTGTRVLVTPIRTPRMLLDRVIPREPWQGIIEAVWLGWPVYEIYRFKDFRKLQNATFEEVKADGFMEPYIEANLVTKL